MTGSFLLRTTGSLLVGILAVLSMFLLIRAHHAPGGGFAGGLVLAGAIAVKLLAHGVERARRALGVSPRTLVGVGLVVAASAACLGPVLNRPLLAPIPGPMLRSVGELGSVLVFDIGVYLIVAGTAVTIMFALLEDE